MDDLQYSSWRTAVARLLALVAIVELGASLIAFFGSGFSFEIGALRVSSFDPWRPFTYGVLAGSAAVWLLSRTWSMPRRIAHPPAWGRWTGAVALIVLCEAPLLWPLFQPGFSRSHDTPAHATYAYLFNEALSQGQFPVRWVELTRPGQSQPLFNYYQVGLYYIVELVHFAGPALSLALKLTVALSWLAGAWFMFLLFKRIGWWSGIIAAIVFAWAPYLLVDVFVRAAYPEVVALSLVPGVLWAVDRYARGGRVIFLPVLAGLTFLMLICHLPTVLLTAPVACAYVGCMFVRRHVTSRQTAGIAAAGLLGLAMAAFYVWPALAELRFVKISELTTGYFDYHQHFVTPSQWINYAWGYGGSTPGAADQMSFQVGKIQWFWILAAAAGAIGTRQHRRARGISARDLIWWLAIAAVALFMMTPASRTLWEAIRPLRFVQFPWRFLMVPAIACGALAALVLSLVRSAGARALIVLCTAVVQLNVMHDYVKQARVRPRLTIDIDQPDWRASTMAVESGFVERGYDPKAVARLPSAPIDRWTVKSGDGAVTPAIVHDDRVVLNVASRSGARLAINSHYVPGWKTWLDGRETRIDADLEFDYLHVDVPPGTHRVEARFTDTPTRRAANIVSFLGLLAWIAAMVFAGWSSRFRIPGLRREAIPS